MRVIRSFDDAARAIHALETELRNFMSRDIDMGKRRVVNTTASRNPTDYVNRRELLQFLRDAGIDNAGGNGGSGGGGIECFVFGIGINTDLIVGEDIPPPHIVTFNAIIQDIYLKAKQPPVGANIEGTIVKNYGLEDEANVANFTITPEDIRPVKVETILVANLLELDYLTAHVTSIGSEFAGSGLIIKGKYIPA